jgi:hypothetical protein
MGVWRCKISLRRGINNNVRIYRCRLSQRVPDQDRSSPSRRMGRPAARSMGELHEHGTAGRIALAEECGFQFPLPGALSWFGGFEHSVASTS